jgi:hypothetical protein
MFSLLGYFFRLNAKGHFMTDPHMLAPDVTKPEVNAPIITPVAPQPDKGAPMPDKPEVKNTSGN